MEIQGIQSGGIFIFVVFSYEWKLDLPERGYGRTVLPMVMHWGLWRALAEESSGEGCVAVTF